MLPSLADVEARARRFRLLGGAIGLGALGLVVGLLTTLCADPYDDAFITFVFARNLAGGHGIAWVPGDPPFYGPTSLAFTALLALAGRAGWDIPATSAVAGALSWGATSALLFLLLRKQRSTAAVGGALLMALSPLAANLSMGMEAGAFTALVLTALWLQEGGRSAAASLAAAAASLTRPEGILVFVVLLVAEGASRGAPTPASEPGVGGLGRRVRHGALALWPGALALAAAIAFEIAYFGTVIPQAVVAKSNFGCDVSGCFSPVSFVALLVSHLGKVTTGVLLAGAALGLVRALPDVRGGTRLLLAWSALHAAALTLARAPSSPWYYAPLVPALFAAFAHALAPSADPRRRRSARLAGAALAICVSGLALSTAWKVARDPFGARAAWNEEKRRLAAAVLEDMNQKASRSSRVLAFEVGYLGWVVPGRVFDLLGLVTPGLQPCLNGDDADATLERLDPDYVLVIDEDAYRATACIHRALQRSDRWTPLERWPRPWGRDYVLFGRRRASEQGALDDRELEADGDRGQADDGL